ncbi:hypothetical protein Kfla_2087 [Kribbella flavida DSM 17836]|uniref:Uncharacterized protein n=1 Tax=Kribbella flavida (strain DSM 17836 / JCM 10339 / NBRC 14399) TaxID=479435 RepID=D2PS45_KRIFD|nr:hypothetical protein [Kribbella flavida]ADB31169.1 hypothetical protein Kfla_2087 [Kribbella flavida DSM 17836]
MTGRHQDPATVYDSWKRYLDESARLVDNDGRLPDGTLVWTPLFDEYGGDSADYAGRRAPGAYCSPKWGWYQGRILAQADTSTWFVFLDHIDYASFVLRHVADLRKVVLSDNEN